MKHARREDMDVDDLGDTDMIDGVAAAIATTAGVVALTCLCRSSCSKATNNDSGVIEFGPKYLTCKWCKNPARCQCAWCKCPLCQGCSYTQGDDVICPGCAYIGKDTAMRATPPPTPPTTTMTKTTKKPGKHSVSGVFFNDGPGRVLVPVPYAKQAPKGSVQYVLRAVVTESCKHPPEAISKHGSNQHGIRLRCMACDSLLLENRIKKSD